MEKKALFGIYTKEVIKNYKEEETIPNNKLVDLIWADEDGDVTSTIDLPEGTYYVKELYASYPYTISTETVDFVLKYTDDSNQEFVVVEGPDFTNDYESSSITLVKLSATTMDNIILNGDQIDTTTLDEKVQVILDQIKGMTKEEIDRIYDKFYQADRSHNAEGNGLGLALVKKIMDITGAKIEVESEKGKGSTFSVLFPLEEYY